MPPNEKWWLVLADFGISKRVDPGNEPSAADDFMAPELLRSTNGDALERISDFKAADMWALGEIIVRMLTGEATFQNPRELMEYCSGKPFPFDRPSLFITATGKDFISSLMAVHPKERLSTSQCIEHRWMSSQRVNLTEELSGLHFEQNLPFGWAQSDIPTTWTRSESESSLPKVKRKPVASLNSRQNSIVEAEEKQVCQGSPTATEEKQVWQDPFNVPKSKQVRQDPFRAIEEKQVWQSPFKPTEGKEVLNPRPEREENRVLPNSSAAENPGIAQESLFVGNIALQTLEGHLLAVNAVAFSPDGKMLVSASNDCTVRLWDRQLETTQQTLKAHDHEVNTVAYSPDGKTLATASAAIEDTIKLWDGSSGAQLQTIKCRTQAVNALAFSPDGTTLASTSILDGGTMKLWNSQSGALLKRLDGHMLNVNTLTFSPDGKTLASASHDGYIKLWDSQSGKTRNTLWGYSQWVNAVALEPSGIRAASLVPGGIRDVAYSPKGDILASAADDGTVRIWDSRSGAALKKLKRHWRRATMSPVGMNAVAFSPGGVTLASGSDDGTIRLWDMRMGEVRQMFKAHSKWISAVVFSPEGKTLASASHDGTVRLWGEL